MPTDNAIVILAEFGLHGRLVPGPAGPLLKPGEASRLGHAMLRDLVDRAHHCSGFDTLLAYHPPDRRGEAEEAAGLRGVWAEPTSGATAGERAESYMRHVATERAYRTVVALAPTFPHMQRKPIFDAAHTLRGGGALAFAASDDGVVGLVAVRGAVPQGLGAALDARDPREALVACAQRAGLAARAGKLPPAVLDEEALAQIVFDLRAEIATGKHAGDDLPLHTFEALDAMGIVTDLKANGEVVLKRAGPPRAPRE